MIEGGNVKISKYYLLLVFSLCICALAADAQRVEPLGPRALADTSVIRHENSPGVRVFTTVGGVFAGALAGGVLGYKLLPHDCGCDDPGLDELIFGAFAGMAVGAALGASAPKLGSVCNFEERFARSLAGAALTAAAAYFVAGGAGSGGTIIAVPAGAIGGSLGGLGRCWKSS